MSSPSTQVPGKSAVHPKRTNRGKRMVALIEEEGLDEDGRPMKHRTLHRQQKCKRKQVKKIIQEEDTDEDDDEDGDFSDSSSGDEPSSESESDVSDDMIPNHEIADMLLSKTAPRTKQNKATTRAQQIKSASASSKAKSTAHAKKKLRKAMVEEVEYEGSPRNVSVHNHATAPDPAALTEIIMSNMEQRKKV
ncbi:hypothetical protein JB92DRAFT_3119562 [Gautieria morchelliformis]|nr:hypothetical protein JB92DRAFT_3119562 [Gautieria morchelliformis]